MFLSIGNIFGILGIILACLVPILGWAYTITYFDDQHDLESKHFVWGLLGGAITGLMIIGAFRLGSSITSARFLLIASAGLLTIALIQSLFRKTLLAHISNIKLIAPLIVLLVVMMVWASSRPSGSLFVLMAGVVLIPFLEEVGKLLHSIAHTKKLTRLLLTGVYVALGFAFIENILYLSNDWNTGTYIGRQILSTPLHIMAAVGAAAGLMCKKKVFTVPLCFILAIAFHTLFNISLESEHLPALSPIIILTIGYLCVGKLYSSPFLTQGREKA